jgi:hypothetical protein
MPASTCLAITVLLHLRKILAHPSSTKMKRGAHFLWFDPNYDQSVKPLQTHKENHQQQIPDDDEWGCYLGFVKFV